MYAFQQKRALLSDFLYMVMPYIIIGEDHFNVSDAHVQQLGVVISQTGACHVVHILEPGSLWVIDEDGIICFVYKIFE